jgi:hypothetical protein
VSEEEYRKLRANFFFGGGKLFMHDKEDTD